MGEEKVYCRHEGENSQRHLEGCRLNMAMRGGVWERVERKRREEEQRGYLGTQRPRDQEDM